jgi:hypothetical protein
MNKATRRWALRCAAKEQNRFEVAWTVAAGKVARQLFNTYEELCEWLERFEFRREFRASVKDAEA